MAGQQQQKQQQNTPKKKKQKSGYIFPIGITILSCICIPYYYYTIQINAYGQANKPEGYYMPQYQDLWKTAVGAVVCQTVRQLVYLVFYPVAYRICKIQDKDNDEVGRVAYSNKACEQLFGLIYFSVSSYWGWSVLRDCEMLPWYLGGPSDAQFGKTPVNTIFLAYSQEMLDYSLYTYGYHFGDLLQHLFLDERVNDFEEMLLHHIAAVSLYFCYIFGNVVPFGAVIAYLHDIADIFGRMSKGLNCTTFQDSSAVAFVCCMITWFVTRIYCLPQMIWFIFTKVQFPGELAVFQPFIPLTGVFLSTMCALHYFWFAMFFKILSRYIFEGEARDLQNEVHEADKKGGATKAGSPTRKAEKLE